MPNTFSPSPGWMQKTARKILSLVFLGNAVRCPVCERSARKFRSHGNPKRENAKCVFCGSLERHRLLWLYFREQTNLFDPAPKVMLHVAPEECFKDQLRKHLGDNYITADLFAPHVDLRMDVSDIQLGDDYFDVIYCSHVLEHVSDDRKAMRELNRVLKPTGWAVLLVPITSDRTVEDPSIVDPVERERLFGQSDHVRRYGPDYIDRLREAGFAVKVSKVSDLVGPADAAKMGLTPASGEIYFCTK